MKYKDRNITIQADKILFFDIDRPFPALIDFFNPKKSTSSRWTGTST